MSAFTTKDIRMETCVIPFAFRNVKVGIEQILTADLFRYVPELGGVLVGWKNIKVLDSKVRIQSELDGSAWIPFSVSLLIWEPKVGDLLRGRIVKHGADFISVVVHDIWNAIIPHTELPRHFNTDVRYMRETEHFVQFSVKSLKPVDTTLSLVGTLRAPGTGFVPADSDEFEPSGELLRHLKLVDKSGEEGEEEPERVKTEKTPKKSRKSDADDDLTLSAKSSDEKSSKKNKSKDSVKSPGKVEKTPTKAVAQSEGKQKEKQNKSGSTPSKSSNAEKSSKKRKERPQETDSDGVAEQEPKSKKTKTAEGTEAKSKSSKSTPSKGK